MWEIRPGMIKGVSISETDFATSCWSFSSILRVEGDEMRIRIRP